MRTRMVGAGTALLAIAALTTGCGSSSSDKKTESASKEADGGTKTACKAPTWTKDTGLPGAFPVPGELTITKAAKQGPTALVDGYWTADVDEIYREFEAQIKAAGYKVLFNENEHHDAEISYKGSGHTGQIALRANCTEAGTTRVHITNRPA